MTDETWMIIADRALLALANSALVFVTVIVVGYMLQQLRCKFDEICCRFFGVKVGSFISNRLTFIGTVHHELSHALLAVITGAKVTKVSLIKLSGDTLGSVDFIPRGHKIIKNIQYCLAALAPVFCGFITLICMFYNLNIKARSSLELWQLILIIYIELSIFVHMTLSKADINMAKKGMPTVMVIVFFVLYLTQADFFIYIQKFFFEG